MKLICFYTHLTSVQIKTELQEKTSSVKIQNSIQCNIPT